MSLHPPISPLKSFFLSVFNGKKGSLRWWVGAAVSLGALYLALRGIDLPQVSSILAKVNLEWAGLALGVSFATLFAKAARWVILLDDRAVADRGVRYGDALASQSVGIFLNTFVPARMGDLARVYLLCARSGGSRSRALGTLVIEKLIDILFLLASLVVWLPGMIFPGWFVEPLAGVILAGGTALAGCLLFILHPDFWNGILRRGAKRVPWKWLRWAAARAEMGLSSLEVFRDPRRLLIVLIWSVVIWLLGMLTNLFTFWAVNLSLGLTPAIFLLVVLQVGVAAPSSPGKVGVFHYLTVLSLAVFAVPQEAGLAVGVLLHLLVMAPIALLGGTALASFTPKERDGTQQNLEKAVDVPAPAGEVHDKAGEAPGLPGAGAA